MPSYFPIHHLKALGPSEMPGLFNQKYWKSVGHDITNSPGVLDNDSFLDKINFTHIALIPMVNNADNPIPCY